MLPMSVRCRTLKVVKVDEARGGQNGRRSGDKQRMARLLMLFVSSTFWSVETLRRLKLSKYQNKNDNENYYGIF